MIRHNRKKENRHLRGYAPLALMLVLALLKGHVSLAAPDAQERQGDFWKTDFACRESELSGITWAQSGDVTASDKSESGREKNFHMNAELGSLKVSQAPMSGLMFRELGSEVSAPLNSGKDLYLAGDRIYLSTALPVLNTAFSPNAENQSAARSDITANSVEDGKYPEVFREAIGSTAGKYVAFYDTKAIYAAGDGALSKRQESTQVYYVKNIQGTSGMISEADLKTYITSKAANYKNDDVPTHAYSSDYLTLRTTTLNNAQTAVNTVYMQAAADYMKKLGATLYDPEKGVELEEGDESVTFLTFSSVIAEMKYIYNGIKGFWFIKYDAMKDSQVFFPTVLYEAKTLTLPSVENYTKENLSVRMESGTALTLEDEEAENSAVSVHPDDRIVAELSGAESGVEIEYAFDSAGGDWEQYTEPVSPWENYGDVNRTVYFRMSKAGRKTLSYKVTLSRWTEEDKKAQGTVSILPATSESSVAKVTTETQVALRYEGGNEQSDYLILYTTDGEPPKLEKLTDMKLLDRLNDEIAARPGKVLYVDDLEGEEGTVFIRHNNLWYTASAQVKQFTAEWTIGEELRENWQYVVYAMPLEEGVLAGNYVRFPYGFSMDTTEKPQSSVNAVDSEGNMTEISMGDRISFTSGTANSQLFYTVNGSAPIVKLDEEGNAVPANNYTYPYTEPVMITEENASYGKIIQISVIAVHYENGVQMSYDSEIAQFRYMVKNLPMVGEIYSSPAASSDQEYTEVSEGQHIQLFCDTQDVVIYYTLNGMEPVYDEDGNPGENTYLYSAGQGIVVPPQQDSLLVVGAVAVLEGKATSGFQRLVYRYPTGVSAPYATPAAGSVAENTAVTLKSGTEGAMIYYTTDGTEPTAASSIFDELNPIRITKSMTVKAIAMKDGRSSTVVSFAYTVSSKLAAPTPSVAGNSVISRGTLLTLSAEQGSAIHYTTDGSNPADPANTKVSVGSSVLLEGDAGSTVTIRTYASRTGYSDSPVVSYSYTFSNYEGGIFADRETGSIVRSGDSIHLSTDVSGASVYYTTDGTNPTTGSHKGSTVTLSGEPGANVIVKAIAAPEGTSQISAAATFTYQIMGKSKVPQASVPSGAVFTETGSVTLSAESGNIYYTLDGSVPTSGSSLYKEPISITKSVVLKAITVTDELDQSDVSTYIYEFADQVKTPTVSYASGELEIGTEVEFSCETEGASIYYTTNGTEPNTGEKSKLTLYTGPIEVNKATTFKIIAVKNRMQDSAVVTAGYTVREPAPVVEQETEVVFQEGGNRLMSRRSYSDTEAGPSYDGTVLRNAAYGAVISAEEGVLPTDVQLVVEKTPVSVTSENMVKQALSDAYGLAASYDVTLLQNGEAIQPDGEIEIGLPIPAEYENSMVSIVYVADDGIVETFETRRVNGMAYAKTDHLSVYSLAVPMEFGEQKKSLPVEELLYAAAVLLAAGGGWLFFGAAKKKKKKEGGR